MKKTIISSNSSSLLINLSEIWDNRYLTYLFFKRNITVYYKQTILGPLWFIIQPLFTTIIFTLVFSKIAKLDTGNMPPELFYMSGIIIWSFFSECTNQISNTFIANAGIFNKIYFPRLILPISQIITNLFKISIQLLVLFVLIIINVSFETLINLVHLKSIISIAFYTFLTSVLSLGLGLILASITIKYKDLKHLIGFGLRLLMYVSPIIYPLDLVPDNLKTIIILNPMTAPVQGFRSFIDSSQAPSNEILIISILFSTLLFIAGSIMFSRVEKKFVDTI